MFHDPLGLVLAIVLQSKLIYQSLCKEKRIGKLLYQNLLEMVGTSLLKHYVIQKRYLFRDHCLAFMLKVVFMKFMDLQMHHLKSTVVLFTCDASWVIPI